MTPRKPLQQVLAGDPGLSILLLSLVLVLFVIYPMVHLEAAGKVWLAAFQSAVLVGGGLSVAATPRLRRLALVLATVAVITLWLGEISPGHWAGVVCRTSLIGFYGLTAVGILAKVFRPGPVTGHRLQGAIAVYLLLGLTFGIGFGLFETLNPGSFRATHGLPSVEADLIYFSFVTLTTVGYGDITPVDPAMRSLALFEAVLGQFFLAVLIARLVALGLMPRPVEEEGRKAPSSQPIDP
ncbi:MAG: potassium channel family protein [Acidobacteriota bacterium]